MREFLAEFRVGMPVTRLAKWKTACQMTAISMILLQRLYLIGDVVGFIGEWLLWIAGILTFVTGYQYFEKCIDYIYTVENNKKNPVKTVEQEVIKIAEKVKNAVSEKVKQQVQKGKSNDGAVKPAQNKKPAKKKVKRPVKKNVAKATVAEK